MNFGVLAFATDQSLSPGHTARIAEERGFESVWFPEHSHLPVASGGWPGGDEIPDASSLCPCDSVSRSVFVCADYFQQAGATTEGRKEITQRAKSAAVEWHLCLLALLPVTC